jgi:hypothetical protein
MDQVFGKNGIAAQMKREREELKKEEEEENSQSAAQKDENLHKCTKAGTLPPPGTQNRPQPPLPLRWRQKTQILLPEQTRRRRLTGSIVFEPVALLAGPRPRGVAAGTAPDGCSC